MPVQVCCPECGARYQISEQHLGRQARCENGHVFIITRGMATRTDAPTPNALSPQPSSPATPGIAEKPHDREAAAPSTTGGLSGSARQGAREVHKTRWEAFKALLTHFLKLLLGTTACAFVLAVQEWSPPRAPLPCIAYFICLLGVILGVPTLVGLFIAMIVVLLTPRK